MITFGKHNTPLVEGGRYLYKGPYSDCNQHFTVTKICDGYFEVSFYHWAPPMHTEKHRICSPNWPEDVVVLLNPFKYYAELTRGT